MLIVPMLTFQLNKIFAVNTIFWFSKLASDCWMTNNKDCASSILSVCQQDYGKKDQPGAAVTWEEKKKVLNDGADLGHQIAR